MVLGHKEGKLSSWIVRAEWDNVIILKGAVVILSFWTNQCTFIKTGSENWNFLSKPHLFAMPGSPFELVESPHEQKTKAASEKESG